MTERASNRLHVFLIYLVLAVSTFIAYEPMRHNDFISLDDPKYVTKNPHVTGGITLDSIVWAFTVPHMGNWHPLTSISHMLDCHLFGLDPFWHHLTNFLFHLANTLLLFGIFKRMTGTVWRSAFVAAAFALHPLGVESVAWVAERKNVLSSFFWILTIAAYIRYTKHPSIGKYLLVVLVFSLGLMAKPMVVTLPCTLLLLDWWPLGRFQWASQRTNIATPQYESVQVWHQKLKTLYLIKEKIPLFILATVLSIITYFAQQTIGAVKHLPLNFRIANALVSYISYIGKIIYPSNLAVLYPHPMDRLPLWQPILCFMILVIVSAGIIYRARSQHYLVVGWLWYLGTLVPVIGLIQVGNQAMADRYTYISSIGIYIIVIWGVAELFAKWYYLKIGLGLTASIALVVLLLCTRTQVQHWQNDLTLFGHALAVTKNNYIMHNNYGVALREKGQLDEAISHYKESLRIAPQHSGARNNLGVVYLMKGKTEQAIAYWNEALKYDPDNMEVINNLAWVKATHKNSNFRNADEAIQLAKRACDLSYYDKSDIMDTLAAAYASAGKFPEAIKTAKKAIKLAEAAGEKELTEEIQKRLQLYESGQPYREK